MKYSLLLTLFTLSSVLSFSQTHGKDAIAGQWTVMNVTMVDAKLSPEAVAALNMLKQCFMNSRFGLHPDGRFTIEFQNGPPELLKDLRLLNNKRWKFNDKE